MGKVILFFSENVVLIYLILLLALLFALRKYVVAYRERTEAVFGLEVDLARRRQVRAVSALVSIGFLALAEFVLVFFLTPVMPGILTVSTPARDPISQPVGTIPAGILETLGAATQGATSTTLSSGCIPGQIMVTFPKSGDQIRGKITLIGTADIPNFGFYKYEFTPPGTETWTTIQAGREVKQDEDLGDWDTSELTTGDYLLRLVVTDNEGNVLPACIVPVRILPP